MIHKIREKIREIWTAAGFILMPSEPLVHPLFRSFNPSAGELLVHDALKSGENFRRSVHSVSLREYDRGGVWPHTSLFEMAAAFTRPFQNIKDEIVTTIKILKTFGIWTLMAKVWVGGEKEGFYIPPDLELNGALSALGVDLIPDQTKDTLLWWNSSTLPKTLPITAARAEVYFGEAEVATIEQLRLKKVSDTKLETFDPILAMAIGVDRVTGINLGFRPGTDDLVDSLVQFGISQIDGQIVVDAFRAITLPMAEGTKPSAKKHSAESILRRFFHDLLEVELRYLNFDWDGIYQEFG